MLRPDTVTDTVSLFPFISSSFHRSSFLIYPFSLLPLLPPLFFFLFLFFSSYPVSVSIKGAEGGAEKRKEGKKGEGDKDAHRAAEGAEETLADGAQGAQGSRGHHLCGGGHRVARPVLKRGDSLGGVSGSSGIIDAVRALHVPVIHSRFASITELLPLAVLDGPGLVRVVNGLG